MKKSRPPRSGPHERHIRQVGAGQMRRGGGLRRLPDLLSSLLDPTARRRGLAEAKLLTEWPTIVGPGLAGRCQPIRLGKSTDRQGSVLVLHVAGTAALELQHSEAAGPGAHQRLLRLPCGGPTASDPGAAAQEQLPPRTPVNRSVSAADEIQVTEAVQGIRDPGLRAALADLGRALKSWPHPGESDR